MSADEQAIRTLVADWLAASQRGELDKILALMTDDAIFLVAGQPPMSKVIFAEKSAAASREQGAAAAPRLEFESEIQELEIQGDWAFMRQRLSVRMAPADGSAPVKRAGHTLTIFKKQSGQWRLARDANLLIRIAD